MKIVLQIMGVLFVIGASVGYTFAELNEFHTNVNQYLHLEERPLKLPKVRTDVNIKDKYRRLSFN